MHTNILTFPKSLPILRQVPPRKECGKVISLDLYRMGPRWARRRAFLGRNTYPSGPEIA